MVGGAGPAPAFCLRAGGQAQGAAGGGIAEQPIHGCHKTGGAIGVVEAAVHPITDDVGNAPPVGPHHRAAGRHRLQQHQAQGLGAGGEQEGIAAGIGRGQIQPGQIAHEGGGGAFEDLFQLLPMGAIAHQSQASLGDGLEHRPDAFNLLFGREAADIKEQVAAVTVAAVQPFAHRRRAQFGSKQLGVHTPLPQGRVLDALGGQFVHHGGGGAEVELGLVVGGLEQLPEQRFEHAHAVVLQVLGQVGVVAGHQGQAAGFGQPDAPQSQHGGIHHVHQVGGKVLQRLRHRWPRQGQLQLRVEGQRHRRHAHHPGAAIACRRSFRAEDQHLIAGGHEMLHRLGESRHDAIDLRQEGFGEKSDLHVGRPRLTLEIGSPGPDGWSRRKCRECGSGRSGRPSAGPHPPPRPADRHQGWWAAGPTQ